MKVGIIIATFIGIFLAGIFCFYTGLKAYNPKSKKFLLMSSTACIFIGIAGITYSITI